MLSGVVGCRTLSNHSVETLTCFLGFVFAIEMSETFRFRDKPFLTFRASIVTNLMFDSLVIVKSDVRGKCSSTSAGIILDSTRYGVLNIEDGLDDLRMIFFHMPFHPRLIDE
jgi:hypothetical protein